MKIDGSSILIGLLAVLTVGSIVIMLPVINEYETFQCVTTPCDPPKITIYQYFTQEYFGPEIKIPDCNVQAC